MTYGRLNNSTKKKIKSIAGVAAQTSKNPKIKGVTFFCIFGFGIAWKEC